MRALDRPVGQTGARAVEVDLDLIISCFRQRARERPPPVNRLGGADTDVDSKRYGTAVNEWKPCASGFGEAF